MTHITQPSVVARLLSAQEVAALLHRQMNWFYKHRRRLEALGFPRPVPGMGRRWDPVAIRHWLDKQAGLAPASPAGDDPNWGRRLDARLAALPIDPALRA